MKKYHKKQLTRLRIALIFESKKRTKYIVKHKIFKEVGENFFYQPRLIPADPELIKFHNNVSVASGVTFINHDLIHNVINEFLGSKLIYQNQRIKTKLSYLKSTKLLKGCC